MYTLYFLPDACSLATQVILHELKQPVEIINKNDADNFTELNPVGTVPVLVDGDRVLREGAAVMLHLLDKHQSHLLPAAGPARQQAIENLMFANATMHPAYSRLFFIAQNVTDADAKARAFTAAANAINALWQVVEAQLQDKPYLGGEDISVADVLLSVYSRWGQHFPVEIVIGNKVKQMVARVIARPSFQLALEREAA